MKNKKCIDVIFILDKSGSMRHISKETIDGFNDMLNKQRNLNAKVTTVLFNNTSSELYFRCDISKVSNLTSEEYYCGGSTALYDTIGKTINKLDREKLSSKVLFIITTDGLENSSCSFDRDKVFKLINKHKDWEFLYLGADIDAFAEGGSIGINKGNIASYSKSNDGVKRLFNAFSNCMEEYTLSDEKNIDFDLENKLKKTI